VLKIVILKEDEVINSNHITYGQLLKISVLVGFLCFGAPRNFCLSL